MDCRNFRRRHLEYLDASLPGQQLAAMREHVQACACCSRFDVTLRRGLMVARSLGSFGAIHPSPRFLGRLRERLAIPGALRFATVGSLIASPR